VLLFIIVTSFLLERQLYMVQSVSSHPSECKRILATSALTGAITGGLRLGYELYQLKALPAQYRQKADEFFMAGIEADKMGKRSLSKSLFKQAKLSLENSNNCKFNWKNVGKSALIGSAVAAIFLTGSYAINVLFGKK